MKIDPNKFLVLVSAIASSHAGCASKDPASNNDESNVTDKKCIGATYESVERDLGSTCPTLTEDYCGATLCPDEGAATSLQDGVRKAVLECVNDRGASCYHYYDCLRDTLKKSCVDEESKFLANEIIASCKDDTLEDIQYQIAGFTEGVRYALVTEIQEHGCEFGFFSAVEGASLDAPHGDPGPGDCTDDLPQAPPGLAADYCDGLNQASEWCALTICSEEGQANFKASLPSNILDCMSGVTGDKPPACDGYYECIRAALDASCDDSSADPTLAAIKNTCTEVSDENAHLLAGLSDAGRAAVAACIEADHCQFDIWSCVESL